VLDLYRPALKMLFPDAGVSIEVKRLFLNVLVEFLAVLTCCAFAFMWLLDSLQMMKYFLKKLIFIFVM